MTVLSTLLDSAFLTVLLAAGLRAATPLLLAALGEAYAERSGLLNLGLEGMMLGGAFTAFMVAYNTDSLSLGFVSGAVVGLLLALFFGYLTITLRLNQIVIGLGVTIAAAGVTSFIFRHVFGSRFPSLFLMADEIRIPFLSKIPIVGPAFFSQQLVVYLALLLLPLSQFIIRRTHFGLALRAVGENPTGADASGISVHGTRYKAIAIGGTLAGLGGAFLSIGDLAFFIPQMTMGQGFMAIAVAMLGRWDPYRVFIGAMLFGLTQALATGLQVTPIRVASEAILVLPYVGMIVALLFLARHTVLPAALGKPYEK